MSFFEDKLGALGAAIGSWLDGICFWFAERWRRMTERRTSQSMFDRIGDGMRAARERTGERFVMTFEGVRSLWRSRTRGLDENGRRTLYRSLFAGGFIVVIVAGWLIAASVFREPTPTLTQEELDLLAASRAATTKQVAPGEIVRIDNLPVVFRTD